jgi:hypothetical protein
MKVWVVEIRVRYRGYPETVIDSIWADEDKAKERVNAINAIGEPGPNHGCYYYGVEMNKNGAKIEKPDKGSD